MRIAICDDNKDELALISSIIDAYIQERNAPVFYRAYYSATELLVAFPLNTTGSLSPTFVPAPPVGVAVKLPSAFALFGWFPTILREPLSASDTLSEATAPVKLPARHCPTAGSRQLVRNPILQGWYPNIGSAATGVTASQPPTYPVHTASDPSIKLE